jgi:4a-hydroxytetrahydrobiopterin dehydratase
MTDDQKIPDTDISEWLSSHSDWKYVDGLLEREFKFDNFSQAFSFITQVALYAEKLNHHPDWSNVYNRVTIRLSTHTAGGITSLDTQLAEAIDQLT